MNIFGAVQLFLLASVAWGMKKPKLRTQEDFEQFRQEVLDAVEELEVSRNGTSRNFITDKIEKILSSFFADAKDKMACSACEVGIEAATVVTQWDWTREYFVKGIKKACTDNQKKPNSVCAGIAHSSGNTVYDILRKMDANWRTKPMACYAFGNLCPMPSIGIARHAFPARNHVEQQRPTVTSKKYILHLSDLHYDRDYEEGAEADCSKPICCQRDSNSDVSNKRIKRPANKWGEYTCDANKALLSSMLKKASSLYDYDMVLFTGDLPAHDMWKEAVSRSKATEEEAFNFIKRYFPSTKVYPAIGNHESVPLNQFPFGHNDFYLYKFMAEQWKSWLPSQQLEMVKKTGYYSINHSPNLKVLVLNNNLYYTYNYYALLDPANPDPNGMFRWMIGEFQQAEATGQRVYIASHIPPGSTDFYQHWSESYHRIIERYAHLLSAQFYGHLHTDEFEIFYNSTRKSAATAISTGYLAPSMSTMNGINPSFRVYTVDSHSYQILDYNQFYADLKEKHLWQDDIKWRPLYSAKRSYSFGQEPETLNPAFWHRATEQMENSPAKFLTYHRLLNAQGVTPPACDAECRQRTICTLRAGKSKDNCALITPFS